MDTRWIDPEIEGIVEGDPELAALAQRIRAARPEPPLDPRFQAVLRAQLMREAQAALGAAPAKRVRTRPAQARRSWWRRPAGFAWGGAGLGVALAAAAVITLLRSPAVDHQVTAMSPVAQLHAVSPNNVITVAFSQPMDQAAVVAGLHIRPATEITTSWQGNNLVITPTHHLAGNTPYTVTIDRSAARSASGQLAASTIQISFGTAPTPPVTPTVTPLAPKTLASVDDGARLIGTTNGAIVATSSSALVGPGGAAVTAPASPSPSASASPTASPSATPTPGASPSATPAGSPSGRMVLMTPRGNLVDLGPAASAAAVSPDQFRLVAAVPGSTDTQIEVVGIDGSQRHTLAHLGSPVLGVGWLTTGVALVAESDRIVTVDLLGHVGTVTTLPAGTNSVAFSAAGAQAYAAVDGQDGTLIDLGSLTTRTLAGSRRLVAFSGDGTTVAWVDATGTAPRLMTSPVGRDAAVSVPLSHPGDSVGGIALDQTATQAAVIDEPASSSASLQLLSLPSGTVVATGPSAQMPVYSGGSIAFVAGGSVETAAVPGVTPGTAVNLLPDGAASALKAFVDAQVAGDASALQALSVPAANAVSATPAGLSRAYVISADANPDGTVSATARLVVDPTASHPSASFADEALVLRAANGGGYLVSSISAGQLQAEPVGPHVVSVVPISGSALTLRVSFDSDLRPETVAQAISVVTRSGHRLQATIVYEADDRAATITLTVPATTPVTVTVGTTLLDVDGQAIARAFTAQVGG